MPGGAQIRKVVRKLAQPRIFFAKATTFANDVPYNAAARLPLVPPDMSKTTEAPVVLLRRTNLAEYLRYAQFSTHARHDTRLTVASPIGRAKPWRPSRRSTTTPPARFYP